jgi:hypothetical protein
MIANSARLGRCAAILYRSFDADLPALRLPVECERPVRIAAQLTPLAASGVGEEHEAALVDSLERDKADGGLPLRAAVASAIAS